MRHGDHAEEVRVEGFPEQVLGHVAGREAHIERESGVVDQDIKLAKLLPDKLCRRPVSLGIFHVQMNEMCVEAFGFEFGFRLPPALLVSGAEQNRVTASRQLPRDFKADAFVRARH